MRFIKQVSSRIVLVFGLMLGLIVPAAASAAVPMPPAEPVTTVSGEYVSYNAGVLKIKVPGGTPDAWRQHQWTVAGGTKVVTHIRGVSKESTVREVFKGWEPGAVITVTIEDTKVKLVEIGWKQPADKATEKASDKTLDRATDRAPEKAPNQPADKVAPKETIVRGEFVSFEDRVLTLRYYKARGESDLVSCDIPENAKTFVWNHDERRLNPVETAEAISRLQALVAPPTAADVETAETMLWRKAGTAVVVQIAGDKVTIRIGENKIPPFVGNLASFKDDQLVLLLRKTDPKLQKSYGDTVRLRMNETIPVYESIDGGEYRWVGTPRTALAKMKEGTILTVFHNYKTETDEFYLILAGVKKKD